MNTSGTVNASLSLNRKSIPVSIILIKQYKKCYMLRLRILESYMNGKKYQSQLPYFIDEITEAYSIHFNSDLFSKYHPCPWVADFSCIICSHAVLLTTTQNNELLTMPCVCLWSFLHVSLKRTVWSLLGIFLCDTKARSIF